MLATALPTRTTVIWCSGLDHNEEVLETLGRYVAEIEVLSLGTFRFATIGPARYFGGEEAFLATLFTALVETPGVQTVRIGTADGLFSALVASSQPGSGSLVVPRGTSPKFLASQPIDWLASSGLVSTLKLLGIETLGDFTSLSLKDVVTRFGLEGQQAYQLASGQDEETIKPTLAPSDESVAVNFEVPVNQVEQVIFIVKSLAEELHEKLSKQFMQCALLSIQAETEYGETLSRQWRQSGLISSKVLSSQVRWQLEGWLSQPANKRPHGGITRLVLMPLELRPASHYQAQLWGEELFSPAHEAIKAFRRLSSLLEPASLKVPQWRGGRDFGRQISLVPLEHEDLTQPKAAPEQKPWPNRLPLPAPATVYERKTVQAWVVDRQGDPVAVSGRGMLSAPPHLVRVEGQTPKTGWSEVQSWAGPWPLSERWWNYQNHRRYARFQLVTTDGVARLMVLENGHWWVEALYD